MVLRKGMPGEMQKEDENWEANFCVPLPENTKQCQDGLVQTLPR